MRKQFEGALSSGEAFELSRDIGYRTFEVPLIARLVDMVRTVAPISLDPPSYARVEARPEGHPWHTDIANKTGGRAGWNKFTAGILLTPPSLFTGGGLYFRDAPDVPIHHYCDLWVWDCDKEHCATRHRGDRRVLIMFFRSVGDGFRPPP